METKQNKSSDDKEYVICTISRDDVRVICGDAVADKLSDADMEQLAHEMEEECNGDFFVESLQMFIEQNFSD